MKRECLRYLFIIVGAATFCHCSQPQNDHGETEERIAVEVTTVALGDVIQSLTYDGDIEAECEVKVFSKIPDRIETFYVDEGDAVRSASPIARIVATTIEQSVRQAEAGLAAARAQEVNLQVEFERAQRLYRENVMSEQQYEATKTQFEALKAQVEQAEALLKSARSQLNDALVTAPIAGIIGKRYYEVGDMAAPALPLVSIVQMERVKITFEVTEVDLGKLKVGQEAAARVKSYPGQAFRGRVSKISPVMDPLTRMAGVEVLMDNPGHHLKPGMFARLEVITGVINDVIVVPRFATIESTTMEQVNGKDQLLKQYYVFVADSNRAAQRRLEVLYGNHEYLAVASGIEVGEKLVTMGQNLLRDGAPVMIVNEEESAP